MSAAPDRRKEAEAALAAMGRLPDSRIDIAEAALLLGALDAPEADIGACRRHLEALVADVAGEARAAGGEADGEALAAALNAVILARHGYHGDRESYDDLRNANLVRVIERRRGLPVALGILYIHAARGQGWTMAGLNFPRHFLVRLDHGAERLVIDPFNGGKVRDAAGMRELLKFMSGQGAELTGEHYRAVGNRAVLIRLQNNVKSRLLRANKVPQALEALEALLLLAPAEAGLWREAGLMRAHAGNIKAGIDALEKCLTLGTPGESRHEVTATLKKLREQLN